MRRPPDTPMDTKERKMTDATAAVFYEGYDIRNEPVRETLCTLGNGYFATRGAHESVHAGNGHYPGTYLAGGYNRLETEIADRVLENEDMVNWPNWLFTTFSIDGGEWFSPDGVSIDHYRQTLSMHRGILQSSMRFTDATGRTTLLETERLVHLRNPHCAALRWRLTPENWSGTVTVHAALDGNVTNSGVERYRDLDGVHLRPVTSGKASERCIFLEVCTCQSNIHMAQAAVTEVYRDGDDSPHVAERNTVEKEGYAAQELTFKCSEGHTVLVEKIVSLFTSRDRAISEPRLEAIHALVHPPRFDDLAATQEQAWRERWNRFDLSFDEKEENARILRLHIFHILQTASTNCHDLDAGIPPRGLHGEAYRGHILWDELFVFSFLNLHHPQLTREYLLYRYRRLDQARAAADKAELRGAMFPWQSGSNGREENQRLHLNPQSGEWIPDETHLQRHVNGAIVYNIWQYFQTTDDREFLGIFGAEIIFEIALFWSSLAQYNPERGKFEIHRVIGPDEYHTRYPDADTPGINNNAYTNVMAAWVLMRARETVTLLDDKRRNELFTALSIDDGELIRWETIAANMYVPFTDGIIEQFEGYHRLKELDWDHYRANYNDNMRLDRILDSEGDSINRYKAGKQADALMLFYLFSAEEIAGIFTHLGQPLTPEMIHRTIGYYRERTSHGSTLSRLVFSRVLARHDLQHSWQLFENALMSDFRDVQGGTTQEGIHLGVMAGTADIIQRCYTGLSYKNDMIVFNPQLPEAITEIRQNIRYRSHWMRIVINRHSLTIDFEKGWGNPITVQVGSQKTTFSESMTKSFSLE